MYQPKTISGNDILQEGKYKVYGANGVIGYYNEYNHENAEIAMTYGGATCGTINYTEPKSWITGNAMVIRPKTKDVLQKFLLYYLPIADLSGIITGSAQPQITRTNLSPLSLPLPPLSVQNDLVQKAQGIEAEIDEARAVIDGASERKRVALEREL